MMLKSDYAKGQIQKSLTVSRRQALCLDQDLSDFNAIFKQRKWC